MNGEDKELATPDPQTQKNHAVQVFKDSEPQKFCPWCKKKFRPIMKMEDWEEDE